MHDLGVILLALVIVFVTWMVLLAGAIATLRWTLRRSNRVDPAQPTAAPLAWLWSPSEPARLHRRLRNAVRASQPLAPTRRSERGASLPVDDLRRDLARQAAALDDRVVIASRQPRPVRRSQVHELRGQVAALEQLAARIAGLRDPGGTPAGRWDESPDAAIARISRQLDLLEDAHAELAELERAAGLDDLGAIERAIERGHRTTRATHPADRVPTRTELLSARLEGPTTGR